MRSECKASGYSCLKNVLYADDMVLVFRTKEALQQGLEVVETVLARYGLTLARSKTETLVVNGPDHDTYSESLVTLGDTALKNVTEFKYLGVMVSSTEPSKLIEHRVASAISKFA